MQRVAYRILMMLYKFLFFIYKNKIFQTKNIRIRTVTNATNKIHKTIHGPRKRGIHLVFICS